MKPNKREGFQHDRVNLGLPQDAQADFAVSVKVGVEADSIVSRGNQLDTRRVDGIVGGAAEQEEEEAALVRCVKRPCDQRMDLTRVRVLKRVSEGLRRGQREAVDRAHSS